MTSVLVINTAHRAEKIVSAKEGGMVGDEWSHLQGESTWQLLCLAREGLGQLQ